MHTERAILLSAVPLLAWAALASAATLDFESVSSGTTFGFLDGHSPGDLVLSSPDGIDMRVETFFFGNSPTFGVAEVGGLYDPGFPTTPLSIDNINLVFDFANVGFPVSRVSLEFQEFGGINNFAVNGSTLLQLAPLTTLPSDVASGVQAVVDQGTITLTGDISSVLIGGQELGIDNIVAVPEPGALILLGLGGLHLCRRSRRAE